MIVRRQHPVTRVVNSLDLDITEEQWFEYKKGNALVQDCFPQLSADDREFIISGFMPGEFDTIFSETEA